MAGRRGPEGGRGRGAAGAPGQGRPLAPAIAGTRGAVHDGPPTGVAACLSAGTVARALSISGCAAGRGGAGGRAVMHGGLHAWRRRMGWPYPRHDCRPLPTVQSLPPTLSEAAASSGLPAYELRPGLTLRVGGGSQGRQGGQHGSAAHSPHRPRTGWGGGGCRPPGIPPSTHTFLPYSPAPCTHPTRTPRNAPARTPPHARPPHARPPKKIKETNPTPTCRRQTGPGPPASPPCSPLAPQTAARQGAGGGGWAGRGVDGGSSRVGPASAAPGSGGVPPRPDLLQPYLEDGHAAAGAAGVNHN